MIMCHAVAGSTLPPHGASSHCTHRHLGTHVGMLCSLGPCWLGQRVRVDGTLAETIRICSGAAP